MRRQRQAEDAFRARAKRGDRVKSAEADRLTTMTGLTTEQRRQSVAALIRRAR